MVEKSGLIKEVECPMCELDGSAREHGSQSEIIFPLPNDIDIYGCTLGTTELLLAYNIQRHGKQNHESQHSMMVSRCLS